MADITNSEKSTTPKNRSQYQKEYYELHKNKKKEYYEKNNEQIKEYERKKEHCPICDIMVTKLKIRHLKTKKHINKVIELAQHIEQLPQIIP
jgi:hypothetical protein